MIFTFYSYKGGVGRSMALANIAHLMCDCGLNVLVVDWDLEAPGLERFLFNKSRDIENALKQKGLLDMLLDYKDALLNFRPEAEKPFFPPYSVSDYIVPVPIIDSSSSQGSLSLLPAGERANEKFADYSNKVKSFDWQDFYQKWKGEKYFEWLRKELENLSDVVLIDSRTGVTEMGGVCTYQMADTIVMFSSANDQSIDGTVRMLKSFSDPELPDLRNGRKLTTIAIPSRIEQTAELEILNKFRGEFSKNFKKYLPDELKNESDFFKDHEIPYFPRYAFEELVAVKQTKRKLSAPQLEGAYEKLLVTLSKITPQNSILRKQIHQEVLPKPPKQRLGWGRDYAKNKIDFAIITVLAIERLAVLKAFGMTNEDRVRQEARSYWRKRLPLKDREFYEIVVAQLPEMANVNAALLVADINQHWKPEAILLVGIAGAASEEQDLGDLVIASDVYYYERSKLTPDDIKREPYMFKGDVTLWDRVITVTDWTAPISVDRPDATQERPKIEYGVIASGEKIIAEAAVRDDIAAGRRKIKAIEMEGYGFIPAIWQSFDKVRHLVIKAICDQVDSSKNAEWYEYAAAVAADFTKHFLLDRPLEPQNPPIPKPPSFSTVSDSRYEPIIDNFAYGDVVPFIGVGIKPLIYIDLACSLTKKVGPKLLKEEWDPSDIDKMRSKLIENLTGLPSPIVKESNNHLYIEQALILAKMDLRSLSQYFQRGIGPSLFYKKLRQLTEAMDITPDKETRQLYDFFAQLSKRMCPKLIVTTNYDTYLEQAFSSHGEPFDVVFYKVDAIEKEDGKKEGRFMHKPYEEQASPITDRDKELFAGDRPIILQLYGRWDNNFVITQDHFNDLLQDLQKLPTDLRNILTEKSILFLGSSPNDYELEVLVDRLFKENILTQRDFFRFGFTSWLIHQCQPGNMKTAFWEERRTIQLIPFQGTWEDFVSNLKQELTKKLRQRKGR